MKHFVMLLALAFALMLGSGCGPKRLHKDWAPIGGSKADASVQMAYEWNPKFEIPETSEEQARILATQTCQKWGYDIAEPFGATSESSCLQYNLFDCIKKRAIAEYQCIGKKNSTAKQGKAVKK